MKSKRAQSEVISTILIILLVLVAIIIVWQVVQTIMDNSKIDAENKKLCLGSQLSILKATAGNGTCIYLAGGGCAAYNLTKLLDGTNCPAATAECIITGGPLPSSNPTFPGYAPGYVTVTREASTSGNEDTVNVALYVNNVKNPSSTTTGLAIYGRVSIAVTGLNVSDEVKVAPLLSNNNLCPATDTEKVKAP